MHNKLAVRIALSLSLGVMASAANADCELLGVADVEKALGSGVTDVSGDEAELQCSFLVGSPPATLVIQINPRDYYDTVSILEPHTPVEVGERGRSNVDSNGVGAVQFVQGDKSVTLALRPAQTDDRDDLDGLIALAEVAAARLE